MQTTKAVILILYTLINAFAYFSGLISREDYEASLASSAKWAHDASNGSLPDRLKGGQNAQNDFNSHAPKS